MTNVFEYIISIKDRASAAAQKINAAAGMINKGMHQAVANAGLLQNKATTAFGRLATKAKEAVAGPKFLSASIDELEEKLRKVNEVRFGNKGRFGTVMASELRQATKEAEKLERKIDRLKQGITGGIGGKIAGWRKNFVSSLPGANLIGNPLTMAGAAIGGFWKATETAMTAGKEKMQMQVLTGSEQIGATLFNGLTKFATDTVFGNEVYDFGTQMLANGIKDADVMPIMKQLGDISMGDANKLGQLSLAFAQINGKGHLAGQELLQLINAGFNPLQILSEKTGESMESLSKKMSKGQISVADVRKAMEMATGPGGKYAGMLEKIANTPYGRLQAFKGQLDQMMVKIGEVFLPIATKVLKFMSDLAEKLGPHLKTIATIVGGLAALILGVAAAQWAWTASSNALSVALNSQLGVIGLLALAVGGLVALYNHLADSIESAKKEAEGFNQTAYDKAKQNTTSVLNKITADPVLDKVAGGLKQRRLNFLDQQKYRIEGYVSQTQKEYDDLEKKLKGEGVGGKLYEMLTHDLFKKGAEIGIYKSQLKANEDLRATIDPPKIPGLTPTGDTPPGGDGDKETKDSRNAVATGGTKNTTINIQIGKQIESLTVVSNNIKEGASKIRDIIVEEMTRAAGMAGALAG